MSLRVPKAGSAMSLIDALRARPEWRDLLDDEDWHEVRFYVKCADTDTIIDTFKISKERVKTET